MQDQLVPILLILLIVAIGVAVWLYTRKQRTERLRGQFGPEYERTVREEGDRRKAEQALVERKERVEKLHIRELEVGEREQFGERWRSVQARFVDDPKGSIKEADRLVAEVMQARGYPVGDFEQRASDVSVDHPGVVEHYRLAHAVGQENERGEVETEDLRQAMVHYRALFEDLLKTTAVES
ncbi:MAG: hypothetical protein Q8Q52_04725 [Acidimicrobiia bacterium]|nr:hypothetical protein [Acidimicrobiia bacterium]